MPQKVHSIKFGRQGDVFNGAINVTGVILLGEDDRHIAIQRVESALVKVGDRVQISYTFTEREALRIEMETHKAAAGRVAKRRKRHPRAPDNQNLNAGDQDL